ncbi:MAG: hypothetical protein ACRERD_19625 [Candidatus Binatia bacterium]
MLADLRWFGRKEGRLLLKAAMEHLTADPLIETRHMKTLQPNPVAQRELRLFGKYRALFNVEVDRALVTIILVGEKRGESLIVQGERFTAPHENHPTE